MMKLQTKKPQTQNKVFIVPWPLSSLQQIKVQPLHFNIKLESYFIIEWSTWTYELVFGWYGGGTFWCCQSKSFDLMDWDFESNLLDLSAFPWQLKANAKCQIHKWYVLCFDIQCDWCIWCIISNWIISMYMTYFWSIFSD